MPVISICVPTYNGREHLAECIRSIRSQSFTNFEVVVCDDQSSDGTLDCARELADGDERFRFISNPRRLGLAGNWNNCVQEARGEWIKFVFQDDTIAPCCLEMLLDACVRHGKPFGFCQRDFIFENGTSEKQRAFLIEHQQRLFSDYHASAVIGPELAIRLSAKEPHHNLAGEPTATLISKSVFREIGGFDEILIQLCDTEFWSRAMIHYGAAFVPESLAAFRVHPKATTHVNLRERSYRGQVLDPLVIRYQIAFAPEFKPIRNRKISGLSTLGLWLRCASYAAAAWNEGRRIPNESPEKLPGSVLAEWNLVKSRCPGLQVLSVLGQVIRVGHRLRMSIHRKAL